MTANRLKNFYFLLLLEKFAALLKLPIFYPLHLLTQCWHLTFTRQWLLFSIRRHNPKVRDVVVRHSARALGGFHVLLSDLDLTVVYSNDINENELERLRKYCSRLRLKKHYIFLGEFELYNQSTYNWKMITELTYRELIEAIRWLRKAGWVEEPRSLNQVPYHRMKSARAWRKVEAKRHFLIERGQILSILRNSVFSDLPTPSSTIEFNEAYRRVADYLGPSAPLVREPRFFALLSVLPSLDADVALSLAPLKRLLCLHEAAQSRGKAAQFPELAHDLLTWANGLEQNAEKLSHRMHESGCFERFNFYGVEMEIFSTGNSYMAETALAHIAEDLNYFKNPVLTNLPAPSFMIALAGELPIRQNQVLSLFSTHLGEIGVGLGFRQVSFHDRTRAQIVFANQRRFGAFHLNNEIGEANVENFIHSTVGELLERAGYFRAHALGITDGQHSKLFIAPTGAGKSYRAKSVLEDGSERILGDEIILIKNDLAYPYPIPIAVAGSEHACERPRGSAEQIPIDDLSSLKSRTRIFLGSRKQLIMIPQVRRATNSGYPFSISVIQEKNPMPLWPLSWMTSFTLGLGLPQMKEYMIRLDLLPWLALQALRRLKFAFFLYRNGQVTAQSKTEFRNQEKPEFTPIATARL